MRRGGASSPTRGPSWIPSWPRSWSAVEAGADGPTRSRADSGLDPDAAAAALVQLELRGWSRSDSAGRYRASTGG